MRYFIIHVLYMIDEMHTNWTVTVLIFIICGNSTCDLYRVDLSAVDYGKSTHQLMLCLRLPDETFQYEHSSRYQSRELANGTQAVKLKNTTSSFSSPSSATISRKINIYCAENVALFRIETSLLFIV